jgi:hypothetical protein
LLEFVSVNLNENNNTLSKILATKEYNADVSEDIRLLNTFIINTKAELIKWMFIFWIGQVALTFGFILLFLKR